MLTDLDYELLSAYIDGALTESERAAFELRLQSEPELSAELDELRATVTLLNNLPPLKAPRDFTIDARYARRSSFFFTSAAFSALSTAAAIILFALGAYLFTGNKAPLPAASSGVVNQAALLPTETASTLDKSSAPTATQAPALTDLTDANAIQNSPAASETMAAAGGMVQESATIELLQQAQQPDQFAPPQAEITLPTDTEMDGSVVPGSSPVTAPPSPDEAHRTADATITFDVQPYNSSQPSTTGNVGAAAMPPQPGETGSGAADTASSSAQAFASTQVPAPLMLAATFAPSATLAPRDTATLTATLVPTVTASFTPLPTSIAPPSQTALPVASAPVESTSPDSVPLLLMGLGAALLIIAIGTTLARRRNRS